MKWDDNLLLEGGEPGLAERGQLQLAMYAVHLGTGHSIYCKQIKAGTIESYVFAAASFLAQFTGIDFRKDSQSDSQMGSILAPVFKELRRYEQVPNRREPYDLKMHARAKELGQQAHSDSLMSALIDGFEQGLCAGYRLSEWAQPAGLTDIRSPQLNHLFPPNIRTKAIVPDDIRILTTDYRHLRGLAVAFLPVTSIAKLWIRWRTQKNLQNGEEKLFVPNPNATGVCCVRALWRSLQRFSRLQAINPYLKPDATPLSVYFDLTTQSVRLVTSVDIEFFMRRLAAEVYHLHPINDRKHLLRWGTHSLRVGACVVLHAMGFSALDIQWILRWRSLAFLTYLRNLAVLADKQVRALDRAAAIPHLV